MLGCEQHRVDEHAALAVAQQGQREGLHLAVIDDAADEVGALVAVEERAQHVHLAIHGPRCLLTEQGGGGVDHLLQVILDVPVAAGQPHVDEDLAQDLLPGAVFRVIDPERGRRAVQVLGGDRRPHEDEVVVEILALQQPGADGIEEGLGQFGLLVLGQQQHVVLLHLGPDVVGQTVGVELGAQLLDRLAHALVVEGDALAGQPSHPVPGGILETGLGLLRVVAEQAVVPIEAGQHGAGQGGRQAVTVQHAGRRGGRGMGDGVLGHQTILTVLCSTERALSVKTRGAGPGDCGGAPCRAAGTDGVAAYRPGACSLPEREDTAQLVVHVAAP